MRNIEIERTKRFHTCDHFSNNKISIEYCWCFVVDKPVRGTMICKFHWFCKVLFLWWNVSCYSEQDAYVENFLVAPG